MFRCGVHVIIYGITSQKSFNVRVDVGDVVDAAHVIDAANVVGAILLQTTVKTA
jgi:hypothetical protein